MKTKVDRPSENVLEIWEFGKNRLLGYADSFRELAKNLKGDFEFSSREVPSREREEILMARNQWENRQVLCDHLAEMAQIMTKVALEVFRYRPVEERRRRIILHTLKQEGIAVKDLFYIERPGKRTGLCIAMSSVKHGSRKAGEVADLLSVALNRRLSMSLNSPYQVDAQFRSFMLVEEPPFVVMTGSARAVRENEVCSGDNYAFLESECGRVTMLLADGTGSGEKAGEDSGRVLDLMEKLIEADFAMENAVNLINNAFLARGQEKNLSTLDICDLDLYEGTCAFYKAGAAASFIKREYLVEQIDIRSLPLGILQSMESEAVTCELTDGDYIIMMTDGVLDALEQNHYENAMKRMLSEMKERNPKEMAERILQFVLRCSQGRVLDDMTVIVLGMWESSGGSPSSGKRGFPS